MARLLRLAIALDLWSAVAVASLVAYAGSGLPGPTLALVSLLAAAGTVVIYNVDHVNDAPDDLDVARRRLILGAGLVMLACLVALPGWTTLACVPPGLVGLGHARLKERAPELKSWGVALAVALAASTLPAAAAGEVPYPPDGLLFAFLTVLVAVNTHALDLVDLDVDARAGTRTLAVARGEDEVKRLFTGLVIVAAILLVYVSPLGPAPEMPLSLLALGLLLRASGPGRDRDRWRLLLDGGLLAPLLLSVALG